MKLCRICCDEYIYFEQDIPDSAIVYLKKALAIYGKMRGVEKESLRALKNLSLTYDDMGQYDSTSLYSSKGLEIAERISETCSINGFNDIKGVLAQQQGHYRQAIEYLNKALLGERYTGDSLRIYLNLFISHDMLSHTDSAFYYKEILSQRISEIDYPYTRGEVCNRLFIYCQKTGQLQEALKYRSIEREADSLIEVKNKTGELYEASNIFALAQKDKKHDADKKQLSFIYGAVVLALLSLSGLLFFKYRKWKKKGLTWDRYLAGVDRLSNNKGISVFNIVPLTIRYLNQLDKLNLEELGEDREFVKDVVNKNFIDKLNALRSNKRA